MPEYTVVVLQKIAVEARSRDLAVDFAKRNPAHQEIFSVSIKDGIKSLKADKDVHILSVFEKREDGQDVDLVYCPSCGSCGESGCCSPSKCLDVKCLYGGYNVKEYNDVVKELEEAQVEIQRLNRVLMK